MPHFSRERFYPSKEQQKKWKCKDCWHFLNHACRCPRPPEIFPEKCKNLITRDIAPKGYVLAKTMLCQDCPFLEPQLGRTDSCWLSYESFLESERDGCYILYHKKRKLFTFIRFKGEELKFRVGIRNFLEKEQENDEC